MLAAGSVFLVRSSGESEIVVDIFFWITSLLLYGTVREGKHGLKYILQRHIYRVEKYKIQLAPVSMFPLPFRYIGTV